MFQASRAHDIAPRRILQECADQPRKLLGMIGLPDLLRARALNLDAERRRERVLPLRIALPQRLRFLTGSGGPTG